MQRIYSFWVPEKTFLNHIKLSELCKCQQGCLKPRSCQLFVTSAVGFQTLSDKIHVVKLKWFYLFAYFFLSKMSRLISGELICCSPAAGLKRPEGRGDQTRSSSARLQFHMPFPCSRPSPGGGRGRPAADRNILWDNSETAQIILDSTNAFNM